MIVKRYFYHIHSLRKSKILFNKFINLVCSELFEQTASKLFIPVGYKMIAKLWTQKRPGAQGTRECHSPGQCQDLEGSPNLGKTKYFMVWSVALFSCLQLQVIPPQNLPQYFLVSELSEVLESFFTTDYTLNKNKKTRDDSLSLIWSKSKKAGIYLASLT